jgi:hypothetical protein
MALLGERAPGKSGPSSWHDPIRWRYSSGAIRGAPVLQLEIARKADKVFAGDYAQAIQIDEAHARELFELLKRTFKL